MKNTKNTLIPGKLYKFCYDELEFISILSCNTTITIKREDILLYLGDGSKLKIKVPGNDDTYGYGTYFTERALFFLIEDKMGVRNINNVISKLKII